MIVIDSDVWIMP